MNIAKRVRKLKRKYKTNNPFELARCLDIIVLIHELDPSIWGYYHYFQRNKIIHLNCILDEDITRIVLAHELGHALLHVKSNCIFLQNNTFFVTNKLENEANFFAAELLLPDNLFDIYPNYFTCDQIAASEKVPSEFVKLKLSGLNIF